MFITFMILKYCLFYSLADTAAVLVTCHPCTSSLTTTRMSASREHSTAPPSTSAPYSRILPSVRASHAGWPRLVTPDPWRTCWNRDACGLTPRLTASPRGSRSQTAARAASAQPATRLTSASAPRGACQGQRRSRRPRSVGPPQGRLRPAMAPTLGSPAAR